MPAVWEPNPKGADQDYSSSGGGDFFSGAGAPTITAHEGDFYLNVTTGDIYKYEGGTWILIATLTPGSSAQEVFTGSGSPEGVQTAIVKSIYIDPTAHEIWVKETGSGNTGWTLAVTYA